MTDDVTCLAPECGLVITKHPYTCEKHWKQLPRYLQKGITTTKDVREMDRYIRHAHAYWETA